jgi:tRNA uridine 5-carbamoylmethylation protein Kti12
MKFNSNLRKLDLENLWWNANRIACRDSILWHFENGGGPAHLTGNKGAGKSTLTSFLAKKLNADIITMRGDEKRDLQKDFTTPQILFIDEAQKITKDERDQIRKQNQKVMMISVRDLSEDGYELVCKIEPLNHGEVVSYVNYHNSLDFFDNEALEELYKASKGHMRLINTLCKAALEQPSLIITKEIMEQVAKRKFKLRY